MTVLDDFLSSLHNAEKNRADLVKGVWVDWEIEAIEDSEESAESFLKANANCINGSEYIKELEKIIEQESNIIYHIYSDLRLINEEKIPIYHEYLWDEDHDCNIKVAFDDLKELLKLSYCIQSCAKRVKTLLLFIKDKDDTEIPYFTNIQFTEHDFIAFYQNLKDEGAIDNNHSTTEVLRYYFFKGRAKLPKHKITWNANMIDLAIILKELAGHKRAQWKVAEHVFSNVTADSLKNSLSRLKKSPEQMKEKKKEVKEKYLSGMYCSISTLLLTK